MNDSIDPKAVCISDLHFTPHTIELAKTALVTAREQAYLLGVPLIIAGDTLDTKAVMRGECVNALIEILSDKKRAPWKTVMLVGNHEMLNEKSNAEHTLNFLRPYVDIIDKVTAIPNLGWFFPYFTSTEELKKELAKINPGSRIFMHQGVMSADMGHYQQDKTSLSKEEFALFRVISGHYHRAQDIKCGAPKKGAVGLFSYIGNPYTLSFGESKDGPKGYSILRGNGLLDLQPLNLSKHVVMERTIGQLWHPVKNVNPGDLVWIKVTGSYLELEKLNKREIGMKLLGHVNFKLDKIPTDAPKEEIKTEKMSGEQILDTLIDVTDEKAEDKAALKALWREVLQ